MRKLHVAPSPLTNRIYCGHVLEDGLTWGANKQDVTGEACAAVATLEEQSARYKTPNPPAKRRPWASA